VIEMLESEAPKSCTAVWNALEDPVELLLVHGAYTGENVCVYDFPATEELRGLPAENQRVVLTAGQIAFYFMPAAQLAGARTLREWAHGSGDVFELQLSYGWTDVRQSVIGGWRGNHWGVVSDGLDDLIVSCRAMRVEGAQRVQFARRWASHP
jgi:hypothetical protein